jgi:hypothetical protein
MNMVILIGGAQMFYRNFGLRHVGGVISYFAMELAGPNAVGRLCRYSRDLMNGCDRVSARGFRKSR